jgi:hypothetical protein
LAVLYAGARACRDCHPGEHASYSSCGHSHTLRPAATQSLAEWLDGRSAADPEEPGVNWSYALRDGQLIVGRTQGGETARIAIDYAVGSGQHATTFVTLSQGEPGRRSGLEHRLSYFAQTQSLGITPGQLETAKLGRSEFGFILSPADLSDCFNCHATLTSAQGAPVLDVATMIPNVSCERCHGPGRAHVEAARRLEAGDASIPADALVLPFGHERWKPEEQIRLCGYCHRLPNKFAVDEIRGENTKLVRFPSVGLLQSRCYTQSPGTLSCTTCHDPHARVSKDQAAYESACLSCHQAAPQAVCSVSPRSGCVVCHMPKRDVGYNLSFSDHWIRARTPAAERSKRAAAAPPPG